MILYATVETLKRFRRKNGLLIVYSFLPLVFTVYTVFSFKQKNGFFHHCSHGIAMQVVVSMVVHWWGSWRRHISLQSVLPPS
jgi:hypothetical protein